MLNFLFSILLFSVWLFFSSWWRFFHPDFPLWSRLCLPSSKKLIRTLREVCMCAERWWFATFSPKFYDFQTSEQKSTLFIGNPKIKKNTLVYPQIRLESRKRSKTNILEVYRAETPEANHEQRPEHKESWMNVKTLWLKVCRLKQTNCVVALRFWKPLFFL